MAIVGLTHEKDGSPRIHRTVNCKVAIGLAPEENRNYPAKLDHFAFLKLEMVGKEMKWVVDGEKQKHFGDQCKEFWIVFFDDDPDVCFRTQMAAFVKTRCWCKGDGEKAERRVKINGEFKGEFKPWDGACANHGCPDSKSQNGKPSACKPSGDLYFMLSDFPTLGTICRIHTSSYQSIRQISSALRDLQAVTGGRLMGVRCKLFVMPAKSVYEQGGQEKTGTKYVLGLELAARDMPQLMSSMAETAKLFQGLQKQLSGRVLEVEEDDDERAAEIAAEFYPEGKVLPAEDPEQKLREEAIELMTAAGFNLAQRQAKLGQYKDRAQELIDKIKSSVGGANAQVQTAPSPKPAETAEAEKNSAPVRAAQQTTNKIPHDDEAERVVTEEPRGGSGRSANRSTPEAQGPVTPSVSSVRRTQSATDKGPRESAAQASGSSQGFDF